MTLTRKAILLATTCLAPGVAGPALAGSTTQTLNIMSKTLIQIISTVPSPIVACEAPPGTPITALLAQAGEDPSVASSTDFSILAQKSLILQGSTIQVGPQGIVLSDCNTTINAVVTALASDGVTITQTIPITISPPFRIIFSPPNPVIDYMAPPGTLVTTMYIQGGSGRIATYSMPPSQSYILQTNSILVGSQGIVKSDRGTVALSITATQ